MIKHSKNVHELIIDKPYAQIAMLSDLHWDNPHADRDMLKRHLDYCLEEDIPVMVNGDLFCCMQGRSDRRSSKSDIRPEHNNSMYLDSIINTAVDWFMPYAHIIKLVGYGNHETALGQAGFRQTIADVFRWSRLKSCAVELKKASHRRGPVIASGQATNSPCASPVYSW